VFIFKIRIENQRNQLEIASILEEIRNLSDFLRRIVLKSYQNMHEVYDSFMNFYHLKLKKSKYQLKFK